MQSGSFRGFTTLAGLGLALVFSQGAQAQDPPKFMAGPLKFQGYVDGYYNFNANHPASRNNGFDRFFDIMANQFTLNMAGFYTSMDPDPVGFTLQLGFGRGWDIFHATEPRNAPAAVPAATSSRDIVRFIPQAYVSVKPSPGRVSSSISVSSSPARRRS